MEIVNWGVFYDRMMQSVMDGNIAEAQKQARLLLWWTSPTQPLWIKAARRVIENMS